LSFEIKIEYCITFAMRIILFSEPHEVDLQCNLQISD
jgi:hypothetical protein